MKANSHRIELPELNGEQAFLLADILEQIAHLIWQAHGDAMADFQGRVFPDWPAMPPDPDEPPDENLYEDGEMENMEF